jgi:thiosulfate/3-mercaptopyruvate sulfurtransferase
MKFYKYTLSLIIAFLITGTAIAQDFISVNELSKKLKDDNLVLVSARKPAEYKKSHIKGAINVYPGELENSAPVKSTLKKPTEIATILGNKGISEKSEIVIYCNKGTNAGRLYWILKYSGAENVKILDGQLGAWKKGRKPITKKPTSLSPKTFNLKLHKEYACRMRDVKKAIATDNMVLIDARAVEEFNGTKHDEGMRGGHIPTAINIPNTDLMDNKFKLKSKEELQKLFASKGVTPDKTVILCCKSSYRAGIEFAVLTSVLNYPNVKVYDGAMFEWEAIAANEVVK